MQGVGTNDTSISKKKKKKTRTKSAVISMGRAEGCVVAGVCVEGITPVGDLRCRQPDPVWTSIFPLITSAERANRNHYCAQENGTPIFSGFFSLQSTFPLYMGLN